ncbi:MAG: DUF2207 domain-containing protein [Lachnospiraceae bacterium]
MKKFLSIFLCIFSLILTQPVNVYAAEVTEQDSAHLSKDYIITDYYVGITVSQDNVCHIEESITAYFNKPCHGIVRSIPLKQTITRDDGSSHTVKQKVTNLSVNTNYSVEKSGEFYDIRIGNANKTVTGQVKYVISYDYNLGKDPLTDIDEFYFNIIGSGWDTYIDNVKFTVTMPSDFESDNLGFTTGTYNSTENPDITYDKDGATISGHLNGELAPHNALTLRIELPEGYFSFTPSMSRIFAIAVPLALLFIAFIMWFIWGRDERLPKTVEITPPEGLNSAELGTIYHGKAGDKEFVSILISLASKGYIQIHQSDSGNGIFTDSDSFMITILKDRMSPEDNNRAESLFLDGLVRAAGYRKSGSTYVVHSNQLNSFYKTKEQIFAFLNSKENKKKFFEPRLSLKRFFIMALIIICYCTITAIPVLECSETPEVLLFALLFPGIAICAFTVMMLTKNPAVMVFGVFWSACFGGIPWLVMVLPAAIEYDGGITYLIGAVCMALMGLFFKLMPKRTHLGAQLYAKACSYRDYISLVEEDKIKMLADKEPEYFYSVLPYAYVLDVADTWIDQFKMLGIAPPEWYSANIGSKGFSSSILGTLSAFTTVTRIPASSGGSGSGGGHSHSSGGGGRSGGGHGGGGGHSW